MRFPFPDGMIPDAEISIEWTLAYVTAVDPRDASDYALQGLDLVFRPNEALRTLTDSRGERSEVDTRSDHAAIRVALGGGGHLSDVPGAHSRWRRGTEGTLRSRGKWETIVRGKVKLTAGELHRPRLAPEQALGGARST